MGFWGILKVQPWSFLDGTLKLRHCTEVFTKRFPPWSLPRVGSGIGKRYGITPGHSSDAGGNRGKRVRLTKKTRPRAASHVIPDPDPGHPTPRRWKRLRLPPSSEGVEGEVGVDAWNLPSEGTGVGVFAGWSVQPKGSVHWH